MSVREEAEKRVRDFLARKTALMDEDDAAWRAIVRAKDDLEKAQQALRIAESQATEVQRKLDSVRQQLSDAYIEYFWCDKR